MRNCPVCDVSSASAELFLDEQIDAGRLSAYSFASRKTPEFMCHRLVRCRACDLIYAPEPPSESELANAYHQAAFDSAQEAADAADAYVNALAPVLATVEADSPALEIGTGTGVFLERLRQRGFRRLVGVEPSAAAIAAAPPERRAWIREGIFREGDFEANTFGLICCFMTLEHVRDPAALAGAALRLLKPGGAFVAVAHDYRGVVNRVLGRKSPIIDIEHLQLFSRQSLRRMFEGCGYGDVSVWDFRNRYALRYWLRLAPLPPPLSAALLQLLTAVGLADAKLGFNVGNLVAAGFRR